MSRIASVTIAILSWNGRHHLEFCLPAVEAQELPDREVEVLVLDNGSHDGTAEWVRKHHPRVSLHVSQVNLGFCAGNNLLAEAARGEALILLNDDTLPKPGWLAGLVEALEGSPPDVAAASGLIVDWQGDRLDFARGLLTFDGHAFQQDYRRPLADVRLPEAGDDLLFACGGNMIVRRADFLDAGGFDPRYFAYLEDVDLGWRLWAGGSRVVFAPAAVVHHRSMATSQLLGNENRGFLFERNALLTAEKNLDAEHWPALMPLIWLTLVHRTQTLLVQNNPGGEAFTVDPYAGLIANTAWPAGNGALAAPAGPIYPKMSLAEKWRSYGPKDLARRGLRKFLRGVLPDFVFDTGLPPAARIQDPRTIAQLRMLSWLVGNLAEQAAARHRTQERRRRSDREIFERFPLAVVPTYPGDQALFAGEAFRSAWPVGIPRVDYTLAEIMDLG